MNFNATKKRKLIGGPKYYLTRNDGSKYLDEEFDEIKLGNMNERDYAILTKVLDNGKCIRSFVMQDKDGFRLLYRNVDKIIVSNNIIFTLTNGALKIAKIDTGSLSVSNVDVRDIRGKDITKENSDPVSKIYFPATNIFSLSECGFVESNLYGTKSEDGSCHILIANDESNVDYFISMPIYPECFDHLGCHYNEWADYWRDRTNIVNELARHKDPHKLNIEMVDNMYWLCKKLIADSVLNWNKYAIIYYENTSSNRIGHKTNGPCLDVNTAKESAREILNAIKNRFKNMKESVNLVSQSNVSKMEGEAKEFYESIMNEDL